MEKNNELALDLAKDSKEKCSLDAKNSYSIFLFRVRQLAKATLLSARKCLL